MGLAAVLALSAPNPKDPKSVHDHITSKLRKGRPAEEQQQKQTEPAAEDGDKGESFNDFSFWRNKPGEPQPQPTVAIDLRQQQQSQPPSQEEEPMREFQLSASSVIVHLDIPPLRTRIERFETKWKSEHGGRLPTRDDKLPLEAADLYALYFERHPEALRSWEARADAARTARAGEKAVAEARAKARAKEWEEWERTKKHTAFAEAKADAGQQRAEIVGAGAAANALSGAASWLKEEETRKPSELLTREAYVAKMRDKFGMDGGAAEFRAEQQRRDAAEASDWGRRGGHEADEAARREAWEEAEAKRLAGATQPAVKEPVTAAPAPAPAPAVAAPPPPAPGQGGGVADEEEDEELNASMFWRRPR